MKIKNIQDIVRPNGLVVFVTGVSGQDGSIMIDYLLKNTNVNIIGGARRLSVENHINLRHLENESRFQLVNFDLTDSHSIYKIVEYAQPDYFINFAAQSFVASSWDFARQTWACNSTAILDCLEAIKRLKPSCRFYNAGSSEEFGNVVYEPQDENHPERPRSPYGASKCAARTLIKVYRESYGMYAVQGWLFNHEGTRRGEEFVTRKITKSVASIYDSIVNDKPIVPIELGNLDAKRDWSDAEDMMSAVWKMLNQYEYNPKYKEVFDEAKKQKLLAIDIKNIPIKDYVVGSGENHTIREFVEKSFNIVGIEGEWVGSGLEEHFNFVSGPKQDGLIGKTLVKVNEKYYRPCEVNVLLSNPSKIKEDLGWTPTTTFDNLVDKMISNDLTLISESV